MTSTNSPLLNIVATLGLITLTVYLLVAGEQILLPLVLAILFSYLITALGDRIERIRIGRWSPRPWLGLSGAILAVLLVLALIVQLVASNISAVIEVAPQYQKQMEDMFASGSAWAVGHLNLKQPITLTALLEEINLRAVLERLADAVRAGAHFCIRRLGLPCTDEGRCEGRQREQASQQPAAHARGRSFTSVHEQGGFHRARMQQAGTLHQRPRGVEPHRPRVDRLDSGGDHPNWRKR